MAVVLVYAMMMLWNALVLGVTAYIVFGLGHSGWWFALALILLSYRDEVEAGAEKAKQVRA